MQSVQLRVEVDRGQLNQLQADVQALRNQTIRVNVEASGLDALRNNLLNFGREPVRLNVDSTPIQLAGERYMKSAQTIDMATGQIVRSVDNVQLALGQTVQVTTEYADGVANTTARMVENYDQQRRAAERAAEAARMEQSTAQARIQLQNELAAARERASRGDVNVKIKEMTDASGVRSFTETFREAGGVVRTVTHDIQDGAVRTSESIAQNFSKAGKSVSWFESIMGDSLTNIVAKMAAWQVVGTAVATVIRSFKDAVKTMKEVDTQLTNIQKVSNLTAAEIERIGESAYDTASKYGVAAEEYLSAVYTFQKAGLGDSAEQMGELAVKTMLVGDTTADIATKFLISANAAWKYGGSIEALSKVVDEADYMNNNYAVSLADIAEAFPIVASTAAQAGLSVEQTMAAITTIVSETAQSGNRVGTALRAIIMNLAGETGELENGVKVTEETMKSLNGILEQFAPDAIAAAEAAGTIVDPMRAVAALAEAVEAGVLNSGELFNLVSELGGKLRANQLNALIEGQETYNKALAGAADAAGTADAEIGIMLSSWESKTQILSNAWTELISHLINTDLIKGGLDVLTGLVKALDNELVQFAATVGTVAAAMMGLYKILGLLSATKIGGVIAALVAGVNSLQGALMGIATILAGSPMFWITAGVAAIYGIVKAVDALTVTYEEQLEIVNKLNSKYEKQFGAGSEYDQLKSKTENLTDAEKARLEVLEGQRESMDRQIRDAEKLAAQKWLDENSRSTERKKLSDGWYFGNAETIKKSANELQQLQKAFDDANDAMNNGADGAENYTNALAKAVSSQKDYYDGLIKAKDAGLALSEEEERFVALYERMAKIVADLTNAEMDRTQAAQEGSEAQKKAYENADKLEKQCKAVSAALKDYEEYSNLTTDSINGLKDAIPRLVDALYDEEGKLTDAGIAALTTAGNLDSNAESVKYLQREIDRFSVSQTLSQLGMENAAWEENTEKIKTNLLARMSAMPRITTSFGSIAVDSAEYNRLQQALAQISSYQSKWTGYEPKYKTTSSSSRSSSSSGSAKDTELERLKQTVANEKARYELMLRQDASAAELAEQAAVIQSALHAQAEYMRGINADYEDVAALSREWYEWEDKKQSILLGELESEQKLTEQNISFLEKSGAPVEKRVEAYRKEQGLLHEEAELLRKSKAYQDGNADAVAEVVAKSTQWWEIQEKINELLEKPYRDLIAYQNQQLELLKALGAGNEELAAKSQEIYESWTALLEAQLAAGASQEELLATVLAIVAAKKDQLALEEQITEEAEKQKELDLKYLSDTAALRKLDIQLAQKLGLSVEEQLAYMRQYADALIEQGKWMEENGASQLEINQLALEYLNIMEEIWELENGQKETTAAEDAHLKFLQDVITLRRGELALMEAMGLSTEQQLAKYRQILEALKAQGEYQKEIGASAIEQNETATDYYNTLQKILELEEQSLSELANQAEELLKTERDELTEPLKEQLDLLKAQHDEAKAQREENEKLLAVEKAREALENARRQRTVRTYNAASGQWEWVADARDVQSAEDALQKAEDAFAEYQYQQQIDAIEKQIEAIEESYDGLIEAIQEAADGIIDGKYDFQKAYKYITDRMKKLYEKYGIDLTKVMERATDGFEDVSRKIQDTYQEIETTALTFGDLNATLTEKTDGLSDALEDARAMLSLAFGKLGATLDKSEYDLQRSESALDSAARILSLLPGKLQELIDALLSSADGSIGGGSGGGSGSGDDGDEPYGGGGTGDTGTYTHPAEKPDGTRYWITYENGQPISSTMPIEAGDYVYNAAGTQRWKVSAQRAKEMNDAIAAYQAAHSGGGSGGSAGGGSGGSGGDGGDDDSHAPSWIDELFPIGPYGGAHTSTHGATASGSVNGVHAKMISDSPSVNAAALSHYGILVGAPQPATAKAPTGGGSSTVINYNMTVGAWDMRHITEGTTMSEVWAEMRSQARGLRLR